MHIMAVSVAFTRFLIASLFCFDVDAYIVSIAEPHHRAQNFNAPKLSQNTKKGTCPFSEPDLPNFGDEVTCQDSKKKKAKGAKLFPTQ